MTNYNERLDEILDRVYLFGMNGGLGYEKFENELSPKDAKQALTSLTKELVAEAKPEPIRQQYDRGTRAIGYRDGYNQAIVDYRQNLLKALEEV